MSKLVNQKGEIVESSKEEKVREDVDFSKVPFEPIRDNILVLAPKVIEKTKGGITKTEKQINEERLKTENRAFTIIKISDDIKETYPKLIVGAKVYLDRVYTDKDTLKSQAISFEDYEDFVFFLVTVHQISGIYSGV